MARVASSRLTRIVEELSSGTLVRARFGEIRRCALSCQPTPQFSNRVGGPRGVNKDSPRVSDVLIPAEPASKSGRTRHNSSFATLAGLTITYSPPHPPFPLSFPSLVLPLNFVSRVCRYLTLYNSETSVNPHTFASPEYFVPPISYPRYTTRKRSKWTRDNRGNVTYLINYSPNAAANLLNKSKG